MSQKNKLRDELKLLEDKFPADHPCCSVLSAKMDELNIQFKVDMERFEILCSIPERYPNCNSFWFSQSENVMVSEVLEMLNSRDGLIKSSLTSSVSIIVVKLCQRFNLEIPPNCNIPTDETNTTPEDGSSDDDDIDDDFVWQVVHGQVPDNGLSTSHEGMTSEQLRKLESLKRTANAPTNSFQATDRLMKELKAIYRSLYLKTGHYTVEVIEDDLYKWKVTIIKIDSESELANDLTKMSELAGEEMHVQLEFRFDASFPFSPPFIRVITPVIHGGHVTDGGALCMELLSPEGWSSAYSMEAVIIQISATFVDGTDPYGNARIKDMSLKPKQYTLGNAQRAFQSTLDYHRKNGW